MLLYKELIKNPVKKFYVNDDEYFFNEILKEINIKSKSLKKYKNMSAILDTSDKKLLIINFYACNKNNIKVYMSNNITVKKAKSLDLKFNLLIKDKNYLLSKKKNNLDKDICLLLETTGTTDKSKYVFLTNKNISYISSQMNHEMKMKKNNHEFIFAPLDHAFGFGRLHSILKSSSSLTTVDSINFTDLFNFYKKNNCNSMSIPAKILEKILKANSLLFFKTFKKCKYIQLSSGFFPLKLRKKLLKNKINLFINYGSTEAMRSTFLNCKRYPKKIHTEGKPFEKVKIGLNNSNSYKGELLVKGPNIALGYSDKKMWDKKFINGWYRTGDLVKIDNQQFISYIGRVDNNVNINGIIYSLNIIEKLLINKFKIKNLKIIHSNKSNKLFLFTDAKLDINKVYKILKKYKFNIVFEKFFFNFTFNFHDNGKYKIMNLKKMIS
jgi:long-subunit acyl-CoA synthetase (AMP-forming)